eukprot:TRINITY_DN11612_c0_g1_i1.p1 TRINITY_DN11612_c0_g1~~TRINITY_DN11612_c0_g1_i1.p1  ORF type:complete len:639 (+),score=206.88 TRINITY_DN11612_c0_g1_i1:50-1918(+)
MSDKDAWERIQAKTFTKWANAHLSKRGLSVESLIEGELSDGIMLANLIEILADDKIQYNKKPKMKIHKIENLNRVLSFITATGVRLVGIGAEEICDTNSKMILGLIWTIILRFVIAGLSEDGLSAKQGLLLWCQKKTEPYDNINIQNFHTSWKDGLGFCGLIHRHRPDLINMDERSAADPYANLNEAFDIMYNEYGVAKLLDAEDIVEMAKPDERSIMTYVAEIYKIFSVSDQLEVAGRRLAQFLEFQQEIQALIHDYEERTRQLISDANAKQSDLENATLADDYSGSRGQIDEFRAYRKGERRRLVTEQDDLATLFSSINIKLRSAGQAPYVAPEGLSVEDAAGHMENLADAESKRRTDLNNRLREIKEQLQKNFADLANALFDKCANLKEYANTIEGELEDQLAGLQDKQGEIPTQEELDQIEIAEQEQEAAYIEVNAYSDHTHDDLSFVVSQLHKVYGKTIALVNSQIAAAGEAGSLSADQIREYQETFNHFDESNSGTLTKLDLKACLSSLGLIEISFEGKDEKFEKIYEELAAAAGHHEVDFDTFLAYMSEHAADRMDAEQISESFAAVANGKNTVTVNDLQIAGVPQEQIEYFTLSLPEADGEYDYNQFVSESFNL